MQPKALAFSHDARRKIGEGVDIIANAVKTTMGPRGRNVIIERGPGLSGRVTKDGVTVANNVSVADRYKNLGVELVKEASQKSNDLAGDGTTATCVLAQAIFNEANKKIVAGFDPTMLKRGIDKGVTAYVEKLKATAKKVEDLATLERVGTISANDQDLGKLIAGTMFELGAEGIVTVEQSETLETTVEKVNGMKLDAGYVSPYMLTNPERMECILEDAYILLTDRKVTMNPDVVPVLEAMVREGKRQLVIVAENVEGVALLTLVQNKLRGVITTLGIRAPGYGERRREYLEDLAAVTGATIITEETGMKLEDVKLEHLGTAKKVIANRMQTIFVEGGGTKEKIDERMAYLDKLLENTEEKWSKDRIRERRARIRGGVAVFKVGAATDSEMNEKKQRIEDAIYATKGALLEGFVPGGGVALALLSQEAPEGLDLTEEEQVGLEVLRRAMRAPLMQIAENAGANGAVVYGNCLAQGLGYNAATGNYEDLVAAGVIDPCLVVRCALQHASSAAGLLLTTECSIITDEQDEEDQQ